MNNLEVSGLTLEKQIKYYIKDVGLNKSVFAKDEVYLVDNSTRQKISNISIINQNLILNYQISDKKYNRLICPVYRIYGSLIDSGVMAGVIKPCILENESYIDVDKDKGLEFHFYLEYDHNYNAGKSVKFEENKLECWLMKSSRINLQKMGPNFHIKLLRSMKLVHFE